MGSEVQAWYNKYTAIEPYKEEEYGQITYGQFIFKILEPTDDPMVVSTVDYGGELLQYNRDEICLKDNKTHEKLYFPWSAIYAFAKVKV